MQSAHQKSMHRYIVEVIPWLVLLSVVFTIGATPCNAQIIRDFKTELDVQASGDVHAIENITMDFGDNGNRTQFFRVMPVWYDALSQDNRQVHRVDINVKTVTMDNTEAVPFQCWTTDREMYLTIGGDQLEEPFKKTHTFKIDYDVHNGVYFPGGQPTLYLNATGEQWPFPIEIASATVVLPRGTDLSKVKSQSLIGARGDYKVGTGSTSEGKVFFSATEIKPNEEMTLVVSMPSGSVVPPSVLQDLVWHLQTFYQILALPVITVVTLTIWWSFYGRDPKLAETAAPSSWRPPEDLTPAEVGTLIDESCDLIDVVSTLFDLAARGFIKIRVLPYTGFLYLANKDYELTLLKPLNDRDLKPHEQLFLAAVFGLSSTTYISAVRGTFAEFLPLMKRRVYSSLVGEGMFARDPELDRRIFIAVGAAVVTVGVCLLVASAYHTSGQAAAVGSIISGLILMAAARAMPRRTSKGVESLAQIHRFKQTLAGAKQDEIEKIAKEEPGTFNKLLPYAIVLGIADQWARIFSESVKEYPDWYEIDPELKPGSFNAVQFVAELGEGLSIINRALMEVDRIKLDTNSLKQMLRGARNG